MSELVKTAPTALALDTRAGWPADLRLLIDRYPREAWEGHANLGAMARFWLQRHDMFREIAGALTDATTAFREGTASAQDFRAWFPPRLQFFLQQLNAHHQVEDLHYFPVFQAAEAQLAHGFDGSRGRPRGDPRVDRRDGRERQRLPARRDQRRGRAARGRRRLHGVERRH